MSGKIDLAMVLKAYDYAESHPHKYLRGTTNWCAAIAHSLNEQTAAPVVERQEPYGFASVLIDTFQYAIDNGKQPTFSKGDLLFFIEQLGKCQHTSPPAPVAVVLPDAIKDLAKGITAMEIGEGKYCIVTSFQNRDEAWDSYASLVACLDKVRDLNTPPL